VRTGGRIAGAATAQGSNNHASFPGTSGILRFPMIVASDAGLVGQGRQPAPQSALPPLSRACSITRQLSPRAVD
jgi:hypothetical protein